MRRSRARSQLVSRKESTKSSSCLEDREASSKERFYIVKDSRDPFQGCTKAGKRKGKQTTKTMWAATVVAWLTAAAAPALAAIEVPRNSIRSPRDLLKILGEAPPAPDAPPGFEWASFKGDVNVSTSILFPLEGSVVQNPFEVMLEIGAEPLGAFKERFRRAFHCVEVDLQPPACWPLMDTGPLPRLTGLSRGPHTLRTCVTDPTGSWPLHGSWSEPRRVVVGEEDSGLVDPATPPPDPEDSGAAGSEEGVRMAPPLTRIKTPPEMSVITTRFVDLEYDVRPAPPFVLGRSPPLPQLGTPVPCNRPLLSASRL